jgi:hypothetical protein
MMLRFKYWRKAAIDRRFEGCSGVAYGTVMSDS